MSFIEFLKIVLLGIVEGITEWLPVSSTGHMILVQELLDFSFVSEQFFEVFDVVIQLGAILAVVLIFFKKIWPFNSKKETYFIDGPKFILWIKIMVACLPAAVIGLLFDDKIDELFFNATTVGTTLIIYGILFIVVENYNKKRNAKYNNIDNLPFKIALIIGVFQLLALIPGTSRSGATILGAILIGTSRSVAAEFTFYLAIPVMFGASLLKVVKYISEYGMFNGNEAVILLTGCIVAFLVSWVVIKFFMDYIKKHDFKVFGVYRIIVGIIVLVYFLGIK